MAMNSPRGAAHTVASLRSFLAKMVGEVMVANNLVSLSKVDDRPILIISKRDVEEIPAKCGVLIIRFDYSQSPWRL
jgi:hypothetical protein